MKQASDIHTLDILGSKRRGRPPLPNAPQTADEKKAAAAARKAKSRAAKAETHATVSFTLSKEVVEGLREYMKFKGLTQDQVIERLLTTQLLRKR